jgi:hypothetical protein
MKSGQEPTPKELDELAKGLLIKPAPEQAAVLQVTAVEARKKPVNRLARATTSFVRVGPTRWADCRLYPAHTRLHHVLIHLSREGRDPVELTTAVAEMAKISRWHRSRHARHLEKLELVHIERHNQGLLVLTVSPDPIVQVRGEGVPTAVRPLCRQPSGVVPPAVRR